MGAEKMEKWWAKMRGTEFIPFPVDHSRFFNVYGGRRSRIDDILEGIDSEDEDSEGLDWLAE